MKLTHTANGQTISVEVDADDLDIVDMAQYLKQLLVGAGYAESVVDSIFQEEL